MHAFRRIFWRFLTIAGLLSMASLADADSFDWGSPYGTTAGVNPGGTSWLTSVKSQFGGTCWDFSACSVMEAKYLLTRNSAAYQPDLSEQQLVWETDPDLGSTNGGWEMDALGYLTTHGAVAESVIPVDSAHQNTPSAGDPWPLSKVFPAPDSYTNHLWKGVSFQEYIPSSTAQIKSELKLYGPLLTTCYASWDLYQSVSDLKNNYRGNVSSKGAAYIDHAVTIAGYYDDATCPTGGYWVIKNSSGSGEGNQGYDIAPYGTLEEKNRTHAETGAVYYTGVMSSETWKGPTSGAANWSTDAACKGNWVSNNAWENSENQATFDATASLRTILLGNVIAHGLVFNASGYILNPNPDGALTITAGGIQANESVNINVPVTIGAPQTWTTAAGKTLNVSRAVHTVISNLTIDGDGNTILGGTIDGGGIINAVGGAPPSNLIKNGGGTLVLRGASNYSGTIVVNAGKLQIGDGGTRGNLAGDVTNKAMLAFARSDNVAFDARITGSGNVVQQGPGTLVLTAANDYTGRTEINSDATLVLADEGQLNPLSIIDNEGTFVVACAQPHSVGPIIGTGTTWVSDASHLTTSSIVQDTLIIGGAYAVSYSSMSSPLAANQPVPEPDFVLFMASLAVVPGWRFVSKQISYAILFG